MLLTFVNQIIDGHFRLVLVRLAAEDRNGMRDERVMLGLAPLSKKYMQSNMKAPPLSAEQTLKIKQILSSKRTIMKQQSEEKSVPSFTVLKKMHS